MSVSIEWSQQKLCIVFSHPQFGRIEKRVYAMIIIRTEAIILFFFSLPEQRHVHCSMCVQLFFVVMDTYRVRIRFNKLVAFVCYPESNLKSPPVRHPAPDRATNSNLFAWIFYCARTCKGYYMSVSVNYILPSWSAGTHTQPYVTCVDQTLPYRQTVSVGVCVSVCVWACV